MNPYVSDCGCVYFQSWRMYSQPCTASLVLNLVTMPPLNDGTRNPWKKRWISPVALAGMPKRFCPVLLADRLGPLEQLPVRERVDVRPRGMYWSTSLFATIT